MEQRYNHTVTSTMADETMEAVASMDESLASASTESQDVVPPPAALSPKRYHARDHHLVQGARATVLVVLGLSALLVALLTYLLLSRQQDDTFVAHFVATATHVSLLARSKAAQVVVSMETLAALYPLVAHQTNQTLPFVTIHDWESITKGIRNLSKATAITYTPLLHNQSRVDEWNAYAQLHQDWIPNGRSYLDANDERLSLHDTSSSHNATLQWIPPVYNFDYATMAPIPVTAATRMVCPLWQMSPVPPVTTMIHSNLQPFYATELDSVLRTSTAILTNAMEAQTAFVVPVDHGAVSFLIQPVFATTMPQTSSEPRPIVGFLFALLAWKYFFDAILPDPLDAAQPAAHVMVVVETGPVNHTFLVQGSKTTFVGRGDWHEVAYSHMVVTTAFGAASPTDATTPASHRLYIFPTSSWHASYTTHHPSLYAGMAVVLFGFCGLVFGVYDTCVTRRQSRTEWRADQSSAIVQELFPGHVASQLFDDHSGTGGGGPLFDSPTDASMRRSSMGIGSTTATTATTDPLAVRHGTNSDTIANFYSESTVLFADIAGFTAWSSTRDPHQVFSLLESIFQSFDAIAKEFGVFKVETIGDCYVAVCGVPNSNKQHAVVMCRFARCAMDKFRLVCRTLELRLGPDTSDLALRVGMHSGPVTAGVIRGERARFQLFGDTVNTASRIESTGQRNRVHLSEQTATSLIKYKKRDWIIRRDDVVEAKGKGKLVTYWLKLNSDDTTASSSSESIEAKSISDSSHDTRPRLEENDAGAETYLDLSSNEVQLSCSHKHQRLVDWNSALLLQLLRRIVAWRSAMPSARNASTQQQLDTMARTMGQNHSTIADEVVESICMPDFVNTAPVNDEPAVISDVVEEKLRCFVAKVAAMYRNNPFHNFEHASHVTMSVSKLLSQINAPSATHAVGCDGTNADESLHNDTYGIASDPLAQFAVVLSALIHDLDHAGVPNGQLMTERPTLAAKYKERSVAEQNSVDLAWQCLVEPDFDELRAAIFSTESELRRFRQLLINCVVATDIFDKKVGTLRKIRWHAAFNEVTRTMETGCNELTSRRATVVIEHLIQASDVAHTMQHWHVYLKWNQRLFDEMQMAYRAGRSLNDPALDWYESELGFFDGYVIPLANKLKECSVFGVASDEYLTYATQNRCEWASKGRDVVQQYMDEFTEMYNCEATCPTRCLL